MSENKAEAKKTYYRIISVANYFLENAAHLTFEALKEFNPSVEELAKIMRTLAHMLKEVAGSNYEDEDMALNAFQCCIIMEQLADAVAKDNGDNVEQLMQQLETHTKVP